MNRPELYKKTVDILYDAYFNDTLVHEYSCGCAVGNIVAANCGFEIGKYNGSNFLSWRKEGQPCVELWSCVFSMCGEEQIYNKGAYKERAKKQIRSTGYRLRELMKIERAFETAPEGKNDEDWMFNGLVAVLEVLKTIHEVEDNESEVIRFKNHYNTKCLTNQP